VFVEKMKFFALIFLVTLLMMASTVVMQVPDTRGEAWVNLQLCSE